jgi:S1-C subfamily serine protease
MIGRHSRSLTIAAALAASAGIGAVGGGATFALLGDGSTTVRQVTVGGAEQAAAEGSLTVGEVYKGAHKGVVEINVSGEASSPFGDGPQQRAQGSGFVYDRDGTIVTNQHVVDGAQSISVRFWNGATRAAKLAGSDGSTDLAVLKVDAPASLLDPLALGDSAKLAVGDGVVAIGSPFGLESTVTSGIVSALHRQMRAPNNFSINDSIQTDAAINHGNSGGPLLDLQGNVIGVNAQIESESGGNDGVGFAIPSNTVRSIVNQIRSSGEAEHAYLGVGVDTIPSAVADRLGQPAGVAVTQVTDGTPAFRAGLRGATGSRTVDAQSYPTGGDVITAIDGKRVASAAELQSAVDAKRPGDSVSLTYVRDGTRHTVQVKLATRPS